MIDRIALFLAIVGGLNWGLVGIFGFDLVAFLFGGSGSIISRIIYTVIALSAVWCLSRFFKSNKRVESWEGQCCLITAAEKGAVRNNPGFIKD